MPPMSELMDACVVDTAFSDASANGKIVGMMSVAMLNTITNAIIFNTKYYRTVLFLGLGLVVLTFVLNVIFIPPFGIMGSAFATLLSITFYSLAKLMFVVKKLHLYPFTEKNMHSLILTAILFFVFYFWEFPVYPLIGIVLKSILVTILYLYLNYKFTISPDINQVFDTILRKIGFKIK